MPRWKVGFAVDAEDALTLADAICHHTGASVRSLGAIVALSAVVKPHIGGFEIFASVADHCAYVTEACVSLRPLSSHNDIFARALSSFIIDNS